MKINRTSLLILMRWSCVVQRLRVKKDHSDIRSQVKYVITNKITLLSQESWSPTDKVEANQRNSKKEKKRNLAEDGFDPSSSGLWARRASAAPFSLNGWESSQQKNYKYRILYETIGHCRRACWLLTCIKIVVLRFRMQPRRHSCWMGSLHLPL